VRPWLTHDGSWHWVSSPSHCHVPTLYLFMARIGTSAPSALNAQVNVSPGAVMQLGRHRRSACSVSLSPQPVWEAWTSHFARVDRGSGRSVAEKSLSHESAQVVLAQGLFSVCAEKPLLTHPSQRDVVVESGVTRMWKNLQHSLFSFMNVGTSVSVHKARQDKPSQALCSCRCCGREAGNFPSGWL
jgi:hypothetical protein